MLHHDRNRESGLNGASAVHISQQIPAHEPRALVNASLDMWLIGGFSVIVWILFTAASFFRGNAAVDRQFGNIATTAGTLSLLVNYPHFMVSYKIAYSRGLNFIVRHWFQLLFVPIALVGLFILSYTTFSDPNKLPAKYNPLNVGAGEGLTTLLIFVMFATVGWHYVKQVFGCMMVYGSFENYRLGLGQRRLLLALLYFMAFASFVGGNVGYQRGNKFYGFTLISMGLPTILVMINELIFLGLVTLFVYFVIYRKWRTEQKKPSLTFLIPLISLTLWWVPIFSHPEFFLIVPMFHSLQYLPFAIRHETQRNKILKKKIGVGTAQVLGLVLIGFFAFEFIPYFMNQNVATNGVQKSFFFIVACHVFINIHHYFIDNVIWKFHHPEVQTYLFGNHAGQRPIQHSSPQRIVEN